MNHKTNEELLTLIEKATTGDKESLEAVILKCTGFGSLIGVLIFRIGKFDDSVLHNEAKCLTFRLTRDTRFSHDKSPCTPAFRAHISSQGKLTIPVGYYLMIKPGNQSFIGGGLFADIFKDSSKIVPIDFSILEIVFPVMLTHLAHNPAGISYGDHI